MGKIPVVVSGVQGRRNVGETVHKSEKAGALLVESWEQDHTSVLPLLSHVV